MINFRVSLVLLVAALCACGTPPALGKSCSSTEQPVCADSTSALVCRDGFWATKSCFGGCATGDRITCLGPGEACGSEGRFSCESATAAMECTSSTVRSLPCRGPGGCSANDGGTIACDMNGSLEGDACASSAEGRGVCTADGLGTLECRTGVMLKTNTCRECHVENGLVICTPP